jgi:Tol biopolymer transport system component/predicted Ser/Thr protein kinase
MIGRTILHYRIVGKLGEGGMGIVYKAHDTKLDRFIALKFLPHHVSTHEMEHARFIQEARAASALNHPNVCVIHAIEEYEGQLFIVMEYVEGKTLRQELQERHLALNEVVTLALQIAEALREAHQHRVVHRDIKSDNIMVNARGQIKVMDFGLAKLKGSVKLTRTGSTVGTLAYMAPEQIEGGEVDPRTDVFSFGAVVYEMLTGRTPFQRDSDAALMYAILNEEPDPVQKYRPDLPSEFLHLLNRALEKDREDRYQSVSDMLIDLRRLKRESKRVVRPMSEAVPAAGGAAAASAATAAGAVPAGLSPAAPGAPTRARPKRLTWFAPAAATLIAIAAIALFAFPKHRALPASYRQLTFVGRVSSPAISPDGQSIAYVDEVPEGDDRVMVHDVSGGQPLEIFRSKFFYGPLRWAPTGSELFVLASSDTSGGVYAVPRLGGPARPLGGGGLRAWSPDGSQFAAARYPDKQIRIGRTGERASDSLALSGRYTWLTDLDWSPRGNVILCLTMDSVGSSIRAVRRSDRRQGLLYRDTVAVSCPRWAPRGEAIYFLRWARQTPELVRLNVAGDGLTPKGSPKTLLAGLDLGGVFAVSKDGRRLVCTRDQGGSNLWLATLGAAGAREAVATKQLTHGTSKIEGASFSPDGGRIAFAMGSSEVKHIYILDWTTGEQKQITFLDQPCFSPAWSPDGRTIAFGAGRLPGGGVWVVPAAGGSPRRFAHPVLGDDPTLEWAPGSEILYHRPGNRNFGRLDPETEAERPLVANDSVGWVFSPQYSPDSRRVAVLWNRSRVGPDLWVVSLADSSQTRLPSKGEPFGWSPDGKWIYASDSWNVSSRVVKIRLADGHVEDVARLPFEKMWGIELSPDARRFACLVPETKSDVWLVENFDPAVR